MNQVYHISEESVTNREMRAEMRDELFEQAGGKMQWEVRARKVFKHGPTATVLRELLFWTGKKNMDPEGYAYITYKQWWDQEGLTRTNVNTARLKLKDAGVLEEKYKSVPRKLFYLLDLERLREVMFHELEDPPEDDPIPENGETLNPDYRVQGSSSQECRVSEVKSAGNSPSHINESTQQGSSSSSEFHSGADAPKSENPDFHDDFPGDLKAIKWDLEDLVEEAESSMYTDDELEALKSDADSMGYYFMSSRKNVTASERHAVFGAVGAAKAKIDAATSFPAQTDPQQNHGSDEAVEDPSGVYVAASMGDALLQAIDNTDDTDKRRSFESLLLQWQRAKDKETAERTFSVPVTDADGPSRPVHHPADKETLQAVLEAVEIEEF